MPETLALLFDGMTVCFWAGLGVIERPAASHSKFSKGQRVVGIPLLSTWQQYVAVPELQLLAVPDSLSDAVAAQFWVCPLLTCQNFYATTGHIK